MINENKAMSDFNSNVHKFDTITNYFIKIYFSKNLKANVSLIESKSNKEKKFRTI